MRFESRDIQPYADPVNFNDLREESVYFMVSFLDKNMCVPQMDAVMFIGQNLQESDIDALYFQDVSSYNQGIRFESQKVDDNVMIYRCEKDNLSGIYDFEQALEILMACSMRRRGINIYS